jgi:hypothetical protein
MSTRSWSRRGAIDMSADGPMNLGPKDQRLLVKRNTLEGLLVALQLHGLSDRARVDRRAAEATRLRRILRSGGE